MVGVSLAWLGYVGTVSKAVVGTFVGTIDGVVGGTFGFGPFDLQCMP